MLKSFSISKENIHNYKYSEKINSELTFYYNNANMYNAYTYGTTNIYCYGYCFDVRNPKKKVIDTITDLVESNNIDEDLLYLNGHFIIIYDDSSSIYFFTDATSFTPIYYSVEEKTIVPSKLKIKNYVRYNPNFKLNLTTSQKTLVTSNLRTFKNKKIERLILDNVSKQNEYFYDKKLNVKFKGNKYGKALLAILNLSLKGQNLIIDKDNKIQDRNIKYIARTYQMNTINDDELEKENGIQYIANMQLMNYRRFMKSYNESSQESHLLKKNYDSLPIKDEKMNATFKILTNNNYNRNENNKLIYDPFNVRIIQESIYSYDNKDKFNLYQRIINILQPTLDFFDFESAKNLKEKYELLSSKYKKMKSEMDDITSNYFFLNEAYTKGYQVSSNLNGYIKDKEIKIYPASKDIKKDEAYLIKFQKEKKGLILIESFFDNKRNAHRIKVEVNGQVYNIDDFFTGKFLELPEKVNIKMWYERNYNAISWQNAGIIVIKTLN